MALAITYFSESAIQAGVTHFESSNSWFFEQVNKVQSVVFAVNLGAIFIGVKELVDGLEPWLGFYANLEDWADAYFFGGLLVALAWAATAYVAVGFINDFFRPREDLAPALEGFNDAERAQITLAWDNSTYQTVTQGFHLTQLVMSVALVFFSMNPYFYGASAALQLYSLLRTCEWKWIRVDRTFNVVNNNPHDALEAFREGPLSYKFSYYCSSLPAPVRNPVEDCPICLEAEPVPNTLFCANHAFHDRCIAGTIAASSRNIAQHLNADNIDRTRVTERENGVAVREYITYAIRLPHEALPNCPLCRGQPAQNEVEITVRDRFRMQESNIAATVTILPPVAAPAAAEEPAESNG